MSRPHPKVIMTPEMEEKFESELLWCIEQLQDSLKSVKLTKKQSESSVKSLNVLMGNSSIVRKRQTMRILFGDYRAKMVEEEKKLSKNHLKFTLETVQPHKNSKCLKKHSRLNNISKLEDVSENIFKMKIDDSNGTVELNSEFKFVPSDNSFRFNFDGTSG